jgi:MoaA/NifB/PqqE/SkfB family radical SAM enzyme
MALIIEKVKAAGIKCLVTTNGTLLDGDIAGRVLKSGIDGIIVSIYGDRQRHDSVTRCKGSFDKTMNAVRIIKEKKTPGQKLFLSTVVFPENPGTLEASARVARDAGVDRLKIEHLNFITRKEKEAMVEKTGPGVATSYVVEDLYSRSVSDKINEILETLSKRYRGFIMIKPALSSRQVIDWYSFSGKRLGPCYFRNHSAVINYNGDVIPCQFFPGIVYGNIKKESIADIWKKAGTLKMGTDAGEYAVCQRCCKR